MRNVFSAVICIVFSPVVLWAQNGVNSVYSAYGVGDYSLRSPGYFSGMGGAGVALNSGSTINLLNPAGLTGIKNDKFVFEFITSGASVQYVASEARPNAADFGVRGAAFAVNLFKNSATAFSLKRRTVVDYLTLSTKNIDGTESAVLDEIEGSGGLYEFGVSHGMKIGKHLSIGATAGYLFGPINRMETMYVSESEQVNIENNKYYNNFYFSGGMQYQFKTGKSDWTLGAFFEPSVNLKTVEDNTISDASGNVLVEEKSIYGNFKYPHKWGAGLAWKQNQLQLSADYIQHKWSATNYKGTHFTSRDADGYSIGAKYSFIRKSIWGNREGVSLFTGFSSEKSYLVINNYNLKSNAFTLGVSAPSFNMLHNYSAYIKVGSRGVATYPLVKENFTEFGFIFGLGGVLQKGGRKYD